MLTVFAQVDTDCFACQRQRLLQAYENEVCLLSKHLDEQAAKLHFLAFGKEFNVTTQTQANYAGVEV